jgi:hypothetical protein
MFGKSKKVRLIFKSGRVEDVRVDSLKVETREGNMVRLTWTNMQPRPLFLNIEDLVAVFEL